MKIFLKLVLVCLTSMTLLGVSLWSLSRVEAAKGLLRSTYYTTDDTSYILVDDFADEDDESNGIGGKAGCGATANSLITCTNLYNEDDGFLQIQYDVSKGPSEFALHFSDLISRNLTDFDTVWIAVKGEKGQEPIEVELVECDNPTYPKELINTYLAQGIITSEWSAAAIPIANFGPFHNRACMDKFNILIRNQTGNKKGAIFVDDIRILPPHVLLDDFHDINPDNELAGDSGIWPADLSITYSYPQEELKLDYEVKSTNPISEAVYWTKLRNTRLLLRKGALSFRIRGSQGEEVAVQLMDCGLGGTTHLPSIKISDYLRGGIKAEAQYVTIPLAAFADGLERRCMKELKFLFSAHPWINSHKGTIYVDDVTFAPTTPHPRPLYLDHFDDCNNWNAVLGYWGTETRNNASIDFHLDQENSNNGCKMSLTYAITGNSSAWARSDLKGINVRDYKYLRFFLKGAVGNEELHVRLFDKQGQSRMYDNIKITNNWQEILIPLDFFSPNVNLSNLAELTLAFEWKTMKGTVYLDEISFYNFEAAIPILMKTDSLPTLYTNLYLRNHTGGDVSYTVQGVETKIVPNTLGQNPFFWGTFPVGTYHVSWYKISAPSCKNSGTKTYPPGNFEPSSPMFCY